MVINTVCHYLDDPWLLLIYNFFIKKNIYIFRKIYDLSQNIKTVVDLPSKNHSIKNQVYVSFELVCVN